LTDIPLNENGERQARALAAHLKGVRFARSFTSPLQRALHTCELAGFATEAEPDADLVEWDYGDYEGRTTSDIRQERPDWDLFSNGCPDGEMPKDIMLRADRFIEKVRSVPGDVIAFTSGHITRVIAARWLALEPDAGKHFFVSTAAISTLGYEHNSSEPVIRLWNAQSTIG
jgi:probable phosphoglycerate mutase